MVSKNFIAFNLTIVALFHSEQTGNDEEHFALTMQKFPLIVDLDGTLLRTDSLHEQFVALLTSSPLEALSVLWCLAMSGRAAMKAKLGTYELIDVDVLPMRTDLLAWLKQENERGRKLHLVSAADGSIVRAVGNHLGIFETSVGSDGVNNLKGLAKAAYLCENFPEGFSYAGDSAADLPVWERAQAIVLAGATPSVSRRAKALERPVEADFARPNGMWKAMLRQFRLHQWSKNLLIFVPIVLAHRFHDMHGWLNSLLAFLALGITATATYIVNDLADLNADRGHRTKRNRPIASGRVPIASAAAVVPIALITGFLLADVTGLLTAVTLLAYLVLTLAYSFRLKRIALLDTGVLGLLFTLRILLGCAATGIPPSPWMLAFSVMLFFSLSMAKRQTEIAKRAMLPDAHHIVGRGYTVKDGALTLVYGVSSGIASLVILMLYTTNSVAFGLYRHPNWLWAIPLLLYFWQMRVWLLAHRGELDDDPIVFALKDKASLALGLGCAITFYMAL